MDLGQQAYWNGEGSTKSFAHPLRLDWLAGLPKYARILDYGCGYGRNLQTLHEQGWRNTVGVDFSAAMIERGRSLHPLLDLRLAQSLPLDERDGAFDAVLLFAVLTCIPSDGEQRALIAELRRLLRSGGLLYVSDYPLQTDARNVVRYEAGRSRHGTYGIWDRDDGALFRHHDTAWFRTLFGDFEQLACEEIDSVTLGGNPARVVQILARR